MSLSNAMAPVAHTNGYEFTQGSGYALPEYPFVAPPELQSETLVRHKVVVVGAGITGLTLACSPTHPCQSLRQIPQASTLTTTPSASHTGSGTVSRLRSARYCRITAARMVGSPLGLRGGAGRR